MTDIVYLPLCEGARILDNAFQHSRGLKWPKKLWWAKEISPCFHVSGRLSERQIRYAKDSNFKSIISLCTFDKSEQFGEEVLPNTTRARFVTEVQCKMEYKVIFEINQENWLSAETVQKIGSILLRVPSPVLLYCEDGYKMCLLVLLHLSKKFRTCTQARECCSMLTSDDVYSIAAKMGYDYTGSACRRLIEQVTGKTETHDPVAPDVTFPWFRYWLPKPVHKNIFIAGQISRSHLQIIKDAGFKFVINMRLGKIHAGMLSREAVTLLNVEDEQLSMNKECMRQTRMYLKKRLLDPECDYSFLGENATENFDLRNPDEFGDIIGYNEEEERIAVDSYNLNYYHMPIEYGAPLSKNDYENFRDKLLNICGSGEPVLFHCAAGLRVSFFAVLTAAIVYSKGLNWALDRIAMLGFPVTSDSWPDVFRMFQDCLPEQA